LRILLSCPLVPTNDGDLTVLKATVSSISANLPEAEFLVFSWEEPDPAVIDDQRIRFLILPWPRMPWGFFSLLSRLVQAILFRLLGLLPADGPTRAIASSDVVLAPVMDRLVLGGLGSLTSFLYHLSWLAISKIMGKPTVLFASDFRPGKGLAGLVVALLSSLVLGHLDLLTVRGENSLRNLVRLGVPSSKVRLAADMGFLLEPARPEEGRAALEAEGIPLDRRPLVGLSIHPLMRIPAGQSWGRIASAIGEAIDFLVEELGATVVFVPRVSVRGESDLALAREIRRLVRHKSAFFMLSRRYPPEVVRSIIGAFDLFLALPFHALVHAICVGVPAVAVDYGGKTFELMRSLGLRELVVSARELSAWELKAKLAFASSEHTAIKGRLVEGARRLRRKALGNVRAFVELVSSLGR